MSPPDKLVDALQAGQFRAVVPLSHAAGHAQADFGEAMVVIGGLEQKAHFFALDLPFSEACFVRAYRAAVSEAWVDGQVLAFAFFGRVPQSPAVGSLRQ